MSPNIKVSNFSKEKRQNKTTCSNPLNSCGQYELKDTLLTGNC